MSAFIAHPELWLPGSLAMAALACASAFFSASETALFFLSHDELRTMRVGRPRERIAAALLADPERVLTAILFWNLVVNLSYFAVSVVVTQRLARADQNAAAGLFTLAALFGLILFGEVLPKSVAAFFRRGLSALVSIPLAAAVRALDPLIPLLLRITLLAQRTFWPRLVREQTLHAEDLERAVEASRASSEVVRQERQVLHNILDLSEIPVEEVMRPRGTYLVFAPPVRLADLQGEVPAGDYLILRDPGSEELIGAIPLADRTQVSDKGIEQGAEEIVYVPWCAKLSYVLQLLRDRFCSVAAVVNEYGEPIGIATYEDIVDTVVVSDPSRTRRLLQREPVLEESPGVYLVEGITTLRYLCRRLGIPYEPGAEGGVTVAGMLSEKLDQLPAAGDVCDWRGHRVEVLEAAPRGRSRVRITRVTSDE
ncbi:MAG: CNNM domain-containing protein [Planctomycetaceae bacterium]